jgi:group I intron endonuclease
LEVVPEVELGTELEILLDTCGIYTITHRESGRCYVGQALNMHKRWLSHQSSLRRNKHDSKYMQNVWNKYFEDAFDFEVVENCDVDDLTEREQWWMDELKPVFNTCPTAGSRRGFVCTAETKAKIGAAAMGNTRRLGMKNTDETKAKMSAAKKGKALTPMHSAAISAGRARAKAERNLAKQEIVA